MASLLIAVSGTDRFDLWWWRGLLLFLFEVSAGGAGELVRRDGGMGDALVGRIGDVAGQVAP